ncbi:MAG TPA: aminotransferase class V-fold PLP-dependent enzyme [Longimicrobiales bacterium]|nr:aminotransferase class V-fold PLP-dependent enzyme [Longimicrobiales bacterium]
MTSTDDTSPDHGLSWSPEEMRRLGYAVVDAVVARHAGLREGAPWRGGSRTELEEILREPCPEEGRDADAVMARALREILPRAGRIDHPRFMAFVPSSPAWPAILGDWLATGFNIFQGTWLESAGPSQTELVVLEWFREWMGLPPGAGGLFTSGGSAANLTAVVAAREKAGDATGLTAYISEQAHSSVGRALRVAGVRGEAVRRIPVGSDLRMRTDLLAEAMDQDAGRGRKPFLVVGNGGATNTGIVDPLPELAVLAGSRGAWFHVDAAYGGFAALTPRGKTLLAGIGDADSVTLDPHKWLFQPYEAGCLLVRDPDDLARAFRVLAEYLQDTELGMEHVNFGDRGVQLTRSFRALKVWMTVQVHGRRVLAEAVEAAMTLADHAAARIRTAPGLEIMGEPSMSIVCFRARAPEERSLSPEALDAWNEAIQDRVVAEGTAMISSTRIGGRFALRFCILNHRTTRDDVDAVLDRILALAAEGPP